jgi:hypothetical protein
MAAGETLFTFYAYHNQPAPSAGCGFGGRNGTPVLTFDQTTQEQAIFGLVMPQHFAGGGIIAVLHWAAHTVSAGTIGWDVAFERVGDNFHDLDTDGFATAKVIAAVAVPGVPGNAKVTSVSFTNAEIDGIIAGDYFRTRVRRNVAADDATSDAHLLAVELREI